MVKMLKPRLQTMQQTLRMAPSNPDATPRQRGRAWMVIRARWLRAHPLCVSCEQTGRVAAATKLDHVTPLWQGGADDESNYQGLCEPCHKFKTAIEADARGRGV